MSIESLTIRRAEPDDCDAVYEMFTASSVYTGTLQLPYPSREYWRRRLSENTDSVYYLVGIIEGNIVGMAHVATFNRPRRSHAGAIGISVHADWQGKGVGKELMRAIVNLADNWLNLTRLELEVYAATRWQSVCMNVLDLKLKEDCDNMPTATANLLIQS